MLQSWAEPPHEGVGAGTAGAGAAAAVVPHSSCTWKQDTYITFYSCLYQGEDFLRHLYNLQTSSVLKRACNSQSGILQAAISIYMLAQSLASLCTVLYVTIAI